MSTPNKERIREENEFHLKVALYHLQQIKPDHLKSAYQIKEHTRTLEHAEALLNAG